MGLDLACQRQVICITHLPQIAVFADAHYNVNKKAAGNRTTSMIEILEGNERLNEISVMLSGPQHTETALENARELMGKAVAWKQTRASSD